MHGWMAFLGVSIVVIVTPGPDTALTIRNTLLGGRPGGVLTAVGVAIGQAIWTLAAGAGIAALLVASEPAFRVIKLAGAAYLVFLGIQAMWGAIRPGASHVSSARSSGEAIGSAGTATGAAPAGGGTVPRLGHRSALAQGVLNNLGNPKMAVFFLCLLPQFAPPGRTPLADLLAHGLVFCTLTLSWLTLYAFVVARAGDLLRRAGPRRVLEGLTGGVLAALGLRLAVERH